MWPPKHNQAATNSSSSNTTAAIQQPTNYVTTSTPVTQSSSPIRHFQHLGLPVASTQYKSPYAVPQSSSGSSAISSREAGPPMPLPMKLKTNNYHQQQPPPHQYSSRQSPALPVSTTSNWNSLDRILHKIPIHKYFYTNISTYINESFCIWFFSLLSWYNLKEAVQDMTKGMQNFYITKVVLWGVMALQCHLAMKWAPNYNLKQY